MKKIIGTLRTIGLVFLSLAAWNAAVAQGQPPDNVAGNWTIYSTSVQTGETVVKHVQITQYGNRIDGYFEGPDQSGPIEGEVDVHHIRFSTVTRNVLTFRGQIYGDNMTGTWGLDGQQAAWQAVRTTPDVAQAAATETTYPSQPVIAPPTSSTTLASASPSQYQAADPAQSSPQPGPEETPTSAAQANSGPTPVPQTANQLDAMVAPIALYPDALVAQVLAASGYPEQIAFADYWLTQNKTLTGTALAQAADQEPWDPSVKALTQFPSVLHMMASNLTWTSNLGQAFGDQQADVMAAVQVMRAKAQAAGTLQSTPQIKVVQQSPSTIVIQPATPQVVYVPQYNPAVVYGVPYVVPAYTPPFAVATMGIAFGSGVTVGAVIGGGVGFGWGWHAWACNWAGGGGGGATIVYNHTTYINNRTYNGYHPWGPAAMNGNRGYYGSNGSYHPVPGYHPGTDTHYGPNGAYHPSGYYGPDGGWHQDVPGTNPKDQPNGGNNGNHGLIGGNGGVQHPPNGGQNGNNGMIGGEGGVRDRNAGMNGPGVAPAGGYHDRSDVSGLGSSESANRGNLSQHVAMGSNAPRSYMAREGPPSRMESQRGRASMTHARAMPAPHPRASAPRGGGGRRR